MNRAIAYKAKKKVMYITATKYQVRKVTSDIIAQNYTNC